MFKIIGFELKKLVSRPGIYILAILLAILLTISAFLYKPEIRTQKPFSLAGASVVEIDQDFKNNHKNTLNHKISDINTLTASLSTNTNLVVKNNIDNLLQDFLSDCQTFVDLNLNVTATQSEKINALTQIHNTEKTGSFDILYTQILNNLGDKNDRIYYISTTYSNYEDLNNVFGEVKNAFTDVQYENYIDLTNSYMSSYKNNIINVVNKLKYPNYSSLIDNFGTNGIHTKAVNKSINGYYSQMVDILNKVNDDVDLNDNVELINQYNDLYNKYSNQIEIYSNLFDISAKLIIMDSFSNKDKTEIKYLSDSNYYHQKELQTRYNYYLTNGYDDFAFANPLSIDSTSSTKITMYDYTYFTMSIFGIIIMIFVIMLSAYAIAGEIKDNTMRFVSIRPVTRGKILFGKFLSIAIIALIMLTFSAVASIIVGGFVFSWSPIKILTIVNASKVIILHPAISLLIFIGSFYLQLLVFASLTLMISSFVKSDLFSLIIGLILYLFNKLLPLFFGVNSWLKFNPLTNINLYAFVGANTVDSNSILGKLFSNVVYSGQNIWISIAIISSILVLSNLIGTLVFKKREL